MPDRRRRNVTPRWNSLVAAAQVMTAPNQALRLSIGKQHGWQHEAWEFYDIVGELRFAATWVANALSRVNLIAASAPLSPGDEPTPVDPTAEGVTAVQRRAGELVSMIAGGPSTQGQIMASFGVNLTIAGQCWLVIEPDENDPMSDRLTHWMVLSTDEVRSAQGEIEIRVSERDWRVIHPNAVVIRCWRRHPRRAWEADAPTHAVLSILREITLLQQHINASAQSRLAGAGILALPSEAVFPPGQGPQTTTGVDPDDENLTAPEDTFIDTLVEAMTVPIVDRGSAAAVVPLVVKVPGEYVDKIKHISFSTPFDANIMELLENAIKRLSLGMDIPPEVLTGKGPANHWCLADYAPAYDRVRGWTRGDRIAIGDEILAVDLAGRLVWSPVIDRYEATLNNERMVRVHMTGARRGEMAVEMTPGHRNVIERSGNRMIVTADDLLPGDLIPMSARANDWATEAKYSDAMVRLIAWYSADGTLTSQPSGAPGQIRIGKSWKRNPDKVQQLVDILTDVFGPSAEKMPQRNDQPMWRMEMQPRGMAMAVLNRAARDIILGIVPNKDKVIPTWFVDSLTEAQTEMFINAWADSDGSTRKGEWTGIIEQSDPARLEAIEYAALRLGKPTKRYMHNPTGVGRFSDRPMYGLRVGKQIYRKVVKVEEYTSSQTVWCPTTETGTWLSQDIATGWSFVTGNSAWQVQEESITLHVEPLSEVVVNAFTIGFLKPALLAEGFSAEDADSVMVWYDTTDLRTRPDRSANAIQAYDRNELSSAGLLRELGLSVEDAISAEEKREKVLLSVARGAPTLAPTMLAELGLLNPDDLVAPPQAAPVEGSESAAPAAPATSNALPEQPTEAPVPTEAVVAACHVLVARAMEKAGARLRSAAGKRTPGGAATITCADVATLHTTLDATEHADLGSLLAGAWTLVPEVAEACGRDAADLTQTLDNYARTLLATGTAHGIDRLSACLTADSTG